MQWSNSHAPDTKTRSLSRRDVSASRLMPFARLSQPRLAAAARPPPPPPPCREFIRSSRPDSVRNETAIVKADRTSPHILQQRGTVQTSIADGAEKAVRWAASMMQCREWKKAGSPHQNEKNRFFRD
jgi:hypothetical protein